MSAGSGSIQISCPQCGRQLNIAAAHAGKQGRCPACKTVFTIPQAPAVPPQPEFPALQPLAPLGQQPAWLAPQHPAQNYQAPGYPPPNYAPPAPMQIPKPYGHAPAPGWPAQTPPSPFGPPAVASPFGPAPVAPAPMPIFQPLYPNPAQMPPPLPAGNPYADRDEGPDLRLAPPEIPSTNNSLPAAYAGYATPGAAQPAHPYGAPPSDSTGVDSGVWGGIGMMVLGVGLFVVGLMFDRIFCYAPVLFVIGLIALIRGLVKGK